MSTISVFDMTGKQVSETELNDAVFGIAPNEGVMHAAVVNYLANQRQGTQSTLTRTEVSFLDRQNHKYLDPKEAIQSLPQPPKGEVYV